MEEGVATGGPDLGELGPTVGAPGDLLAAAGVAHLGLELVGMRTASQDGVHHLSLPRVMPWSLPSGAGDPHPHSYRSSDGIKNHSTG